MNELQQALLFMRRGNRKEIALEEYIHLQEQKKRPWTKQKKYRFIAQVQQSQVLVFSYECDCVGVRRVLKVKEDRSVKRSKKTKKPTAYPYYAVEKRKKNKALSNWTIHLMVKKEREAKKTLVFFTREQVNAPSLNEVPIVYT